MEKAGEARYMPPSTSTIAPSSPAPAQVLALVSLPVLRNVMGQRLADAHLWEQRANGLPLVLGATPIGGTHG